MFEKCFEFFAFAALVKSLAQTMGIMGCNGNFLTLHHGELVGSVEGIPSLFGPNVGRVCVLLQPVAVGVYLPSPPSCAMWYALLLGWRWCMLCVY